MSIEEEILKVVRSHVSEEAVKELVQLELRSLSVKKSPAYGSGEQKSDIERAVQSHVRELAGQEVVRIARTPEFVEKVSTLVAEELLKPENVSGVVRTVVSAFLEPLIKSSRGY